MYRYLKQTDKESVCTQFSDFNLMNLGHITEWSIDLKDEAIRNIEDREKLVVADREIV